MSTAIRGHYTSDNLNSYYGPSMDMHVAVLAIEFLFSGVPRTLLHSREGFALAANADFQLCHVSRTEVSYSRKIRMKSPVIVFSRSR